MSSSLVACPRCGRVDTVRKVSAIVRQGTRTASGVGLTLLAGKGGLELAPTMHTSTSSSTLAAMLAPPSKPAAPMGNGCLAALIFSRVGLVLVSIPIVLAVATCVFLSLGNVYVQSRVLGMVALIVILAFLVANGLRKVRSSIEDVRSVRAERADYERRIQEWERVYTRWQQLYYCQRDDGAFIPNQGAFIPLHKIDAYFFSEEKRKRDPNGPP